MFGENLKAMRKAKGYTQQELAMKLNVVRQTVSKWEKGLSVPDAEILVEIADVLDTKKQKKQKNLESGRNYFAYYNYF